MSRTKNEPNQIDQNEKIDIDASAAADTLMNPPEAANSGKSGVKGFFQQTTALIRKVLANREVVAYIVVGAFTSLLSIALYGFLMRFRFSVPVTNTIVTVIVVVIAYFTNKVFVFRSMSFKAGVLLREISSFFAGRFFTYVFETAALTVLVDVCKFPEFPMKIVVTVVVIALNYVISKKAVFVLPQKKTP